MEYFPGALVKFRTCHGIVVERKTLDLWRWWTVFTEEVMN